MGTARASRLTGQDAVTSAPGGYRISEVARMAGVSTSTLRLWERHGVLRPRRSGARYRLYDDRDVARVRDIRRLREVQGLNIAAIRTVLPASEPSAGESLLGQRLRALRRKAGMTLRAASRATGLAPSFIATLERTSGGASYTSLRKLADCYGVLVGELTRTPAAASAKGMRLVRSGRGRILPTLGKGIVAEILAEGDLHMECQRMLLEPGAGSDGTYAHTGQEFIFVLNGQFELCLAGQARQTLRAGDSAYFDSSISHAWRNPGRTPTDVVWVNSPPSY
ncbi:MAG: MerR family transcriptional regulator [Alphaproteobacteria bacterium]